MNTIEVYAYAYAIKFAPPHSPGLLAISFDEAVEQLFTLLKNKDYFVMISNVDGTLLRQKEQILTDGLGHSSRI